MSSLNIYVADRQSNKRGLGKKGKGQSLSHLKGINISSKYNDYGFNIYQKINLSRFSLSKYIRNQRAM